jgi:hypothetical protein
LVEHILGKDEVIGSIPIVGSRKAPQHPAGRKGERNTVQEKSNNSKPPQQFTDALYRPPLPLSFRPQLISIRHG